MKDCWIEDKLIKLKDVKNVQVNDPASKRNPYMRGMANGLILADAIFEEKDPEYIDSPLSEEKPKFCYAPIKSSELPPSYPQIPSNTTSPEENKPKLQREWRAGTDIEQGQLVYIKDDLVYPFESKPKEWCVCKKPDIYEDFPNCNKCGKSIKPQSSQGIEKLPISMDYVDIRGKINELIDYINSQGK